MSAHYQSGAMGYADEWEGLDNALPVAVDIAYTGCRNSGIEIEQAGCYADGPFCLADSEVDHYKQKVMDYLERMP